MAKAKSKPAKEEFDDFEEEDYDYSDESKSKEKNIFGKAYSFLEEKYFAFSDWLSKKGIPLDKLNTFLEEKGIPSFAAVTCFFFLLLAIIILIIINIATTATIELNITDYSNNSLSDVQLIVSDLYGKTKFSGIVNDGDKIKAKLKSGSDYVIEATKSDLENYNNQIVFVRGDKFNIKFNEKYTTGDLSIVVTDTQTKKKVPLYEVKLNFRINGEAKEEVAIADEKGEISFTNIPLDKDITLTVNADGYQTYSQNFRLLNSVETKNIELAFDEDSILLSRKESKVTIVVTKENGDLIDAADVTIYNTAGEIIATNLTVLGKSVFTLNSGQAIRFVVSKEGYRTYDSDKEERSYRIQNPEETYTAKLIAGSSDLKVKVLEKGVGPLSEAEVSLYNSSNNLIESKTTQLDGIVIFTGLDKNTEYIVTACKTGYYCLQSFANIEEENEIQQELEKVSIDTSALLSIYVYDSLNSPMTNAKVNVFKEVMSRYVATGHGTLSVDLTGQTSIMTKHGDKYKVTAIVGEVEKTEEITIDPFKDNKLILILDQASRFITLNLTDKDGNPITEGCVLIKSKTGEILFDDCLNGSNIVEFNNKGYKDLIVEYTDIEGNTTTMSTRLGDSDEINLKIKQTTVGNNPVISFLELRDSYNSLTPILSLDKEYYAVFDVLIPEGATSCAVHFRAGDDEQTDSDNMTYGITGYKADTTNYKYSTTYTPGQQSIDYDNSGSPNQINKWLELYWKNLDQITNKQIMIKLKATELDEKFILKYRVWCESEGKVYRDPIDSVLGETRSNSQKQFLYADTKEQTFDVLETPADCSGDLCIDYKFIDDSSFEYTPEKFYAVKEGLYALELSFLSMKNTELSIDSETDKSRPIIGLVNYQDTGMFPSNTVASEEVQLSYTNLNLEATKRKAVYLFFIAKETGSTYLDLKINNNSKITEKRISFNVVPRKTMEVLVKDVIPYNSPIVVEIKDKDTKKIVDTAFVKVSDDSGSLLGSVKNSKTGKYIINQNFSVAKPILEVTAPGYAPYAKHLIIADTGILSAPDRLEIRFGENISQESESFTIINKSSQEIIDLTYQLNYIDYVASMQATLDLPAVLKSGKSENLELITTVDPKANFKTAKGILTISGFIGNKQVVKEIEVIYYRGTIESDCLEIKPKQLFAYVGISEGSSQELMFSVHNNCQKAISITPELLNSRGTKIRKDENIEIIIPNIDIEANEQIDDYTIVVKNNKERKLTKTYNFEIAWRNQYFVFENTKLNVELVDLSKSLVVIPLASAISLVQVVDQQPALNQTRFILKNVGKYPLTDIQISRFEATTYSNIEDKIEPPSFESIKPGESKSITIRYSGKIDKATYADLYYQVTANAVGVSTPITTKFSVGFMFSSAGCLKLDQTKISFYSKVNEEKTKLINITNQCAEPVGLITHDQGNSTYFIDTFGDGTQVSIYPAVAAPVIYPGQTIGYFIRIKPTKYFTPKTDRVVRLLGVPTNYGQGGRVTSNTFLFSIELEPEHPDQEEDYKRVEENISIPVCGKDSESDDSTVDYTFPVIVPDCKQDGYCDSYSAAEFILEKMQSLHTELINSSNQANNKVVQTACSQTAANNGYCPISDILPPQKLQEYKNILLYLQNDNLSERTIELLLKDGNTSATKYPTIKDYMVKANVGYTTGGLGFSGNVIHISNKLNGCGRYKLEIIGAIATKNYTDLDPQRAYFFLDVVDANKTDQCKKNIENVMIFLPKDLKFRRTNTGDTWLTIITGSKDFAQPIAKDVFGSEDRFVLKSVEQKKYSLLDVTIGELKDSESDAIAKMYYKDSVDSNNSKAEEVSIIINDKFGIKKEGIKDVNYPAEFITDTSRSIKAILEGKPANICISEDKSYMLIMSIDSDYGSLFLKSKADGKLQLKPTKTCTEFTVKSAVNEQVSISYEDLSGIQLNFNYDGKDYPSPMPLILEKDKELDFNVCIKSDISQISSWNNKELKVIAESKFSEVGKINSKRKGEAIVKLSSYGITPMELLSVIQTTKDEMIKDKKDNEIIYAYVDWEKDYSSLNVEEYCKTLERYNLKLGDKETTFRKPAECDFEESKSEKKAKINRASKKALTYTGVCFGSCAALQALSTVIWNAVPIASQTKYVKDLLLNCGLGCGIPGAGLYLDESETGESFFKTLDKITDIPIIKQIKDIVGGLFSFLGKLIPGEEGAVSDGDMLTTGTGIATARAIKREMPGAYDTVDEFINPAITNNTINGPPIGPPLAGNDLINFNAQLTNQHTYISRYVNKTPVNPNQFVFNPANSADDAFLKTILPKISDGSGNLDLVKFNALDPKDLSDFKAVIDRGSYVGKAGLIQPDKAKFLSRLDTHIASKTPSSSTVVKEMTEDVLNQSLKSAKAQDKALKARAEAVQSRLNKKTKIKNPSSKAKKEISKLTDELDEVKKLQTATTDRLKTFESVKANGSKGGIYTIDDAAAKTLSQADNTIATIAKPTSRLTKFGVGIGRFASDLLVVYLSNKLANEAVDVLTEEGQLDNMIYVNDTVPIREFKKQTWYRVQIYKAENNSYSQVYTLEEPNITTENIIYYRTNSEVVKLITTEHQEEMYQTNNPQTSDPYTPSMAGDIGLNTEDIATIAELQAKMFKEKENQLKGYNECLFSTSGSVCNNLDPLKPDYCSAFVKRVAKEVYGLDYNPGDACVSSTENFGTINKVIWQRGKDSEDDFENYLIPGAAITIGNYGSNELSCNPSHVALYVGKQGGSTHYILHQWGEKSHLEPLFSSQSGRFTLSKNVYQIVIPKNGYSLYDQFILNRNVATDTTEAYTKKSETINTTEVVEYAKTFIGNKYVWGGTDPNTGADCSGFVKYVYANFDVSLPRVAKSQAKCGVTINSLDSANPGDLIFYSNNGEINGVYHVTIYAGNGEMVHASNSSPYPKGGIKESNVYDQQKIYAIKRVSDVDHC